jgi:ketosteroid isomerase-like protein
MWDDQLVRAFADAITDRDVEWALELCHPEVELFSLMAQLDASPYRGYAGIRRYFRDVDATWDEWRVDVEQLVPAPDGRVVIVMSTHMRGKSSGLPFTQRVANLWEFRDDKLWRATLYRDPAEAVRAIDKSQGWPPGPPSRPVRGCRRLAARLSAAASGRPVRSALGRVLS